MHEMISSNQITRRNVFMGLILLTVDVTSKLTEYRAKVFETENMELPMISKLECNGTSTVS